MFELQTDREVRERLVARVVARSVLSDLAPGDPMLQLLGAAALEFEGVYLAAAEILALFNLDDATGEDLDERGAEVLPDGLPRGGASRAVGQLRWTAPNAVAVEVPIPAGTVGARAGSPPTNYVTTEAGRIPVGSTQSEALTGGDIAAAAAAPGGAANAAIDSVQVFVGAVPNATILTNPAPFQGGRDAESDADYRDRIRAHLRTLSRCIPEALEQRARSAEVAGRRVTAARTWEDPVNRGHVVVYIDDGSGQPAETAAAAAVVFTDAVAGAVGGEQEFYVPLWPVFGSLTVTHTPSGGPAAVLTEGTDYVLIGSRGLVWLTSSAFPTGLATGAKLEVSAYTHYAGLIREAQRRIEGDPADRVNYPTWRAGGVVVDVLPPVLRQVTVTAHVVADVDADREAVVANVRRALAAYVNGLGIGRAVVHSELVERAMGVAGMYDVTIEAPAANIPVAFNAVARVTTANLTVL
jgi:uncharacterized phage protein gp47/JayE